MTPDDLNELLLANREIAHLRRQLELATALIEDQRKLFAQLAAAERTLASMGFAFKDGCWVNQNLQ